MACTKETYCADLQVFPNLKRFSSSVGVSEERLVRVYEIEAEYHSLILSQAATSIRVRLYQEMYDRVHSLLVPNTSQGEGPPRAVINKVRAFRRELFGRAVLDVGCGAGWFLRVVADSLPHGRLLGIDGSASVLPASNPSKGLCFSRSDISEFHFNQEFDAVVSDNVFEHLAPIDAERHLDSVARALKPGGTLILMAPNRLWGPADITRIVDGSYTNRLPARGSHLNEPTYGEIIPLLGRCGFRNFRSVLPFFHHFPIVGSWRVSPSFYRAVERIRPIRSLSYALRRNGRAVWTNPVTIVCERNGR